MVSISARLAGSIPYSSFDVLGTHTVNAKDKNKIVDNNNLFFID